MIREFTMHRSIPVHRFFKERSKPSATVYSSKHWQRVLFVLDWDDTIFPTTVFMREQEAIEAEVGIKIHTASVQVNIPRSYQEKIIDLIRYMKRRGDVILITNASISWVIESCILHMPYLYNYLIYEVPIISASDNYASIRPTEVYSWKFYALYHYLLGVIWKRYSHVMSIGDSEYEHHAVKQLARCFTEERHENTYMPSAIRLQSSPGTLSIMIKQVSDIQATISDYMTILRHQQ